MNRRFLILAALACLPVSGVAQAESPKPRKETLSLAERLVDDLNIWHQPKNHRVRIIVYSPQRYDSETGRYEDDELQEVEFGNLADFLAMLQPPKEVDANAKLRRCPGCAGSCMSKSGNFQWCVECGWDNGLCRVSKAERSAVEKTQGHELPGSGDEKWRRVDERSAGKTQAEREEIIHEEYSRGSTIQCGPEE